MHSMLSKRKMYQNRPFYTKNGGEKLTLWCHISKLWHLDQKENFKIT